MTISELREILDKLEKKHGDIPVIIYAADFYAYPNIFCGGVLKNSNHEEIQAPSVVLMTDGPFVSGRCIYGEDA